MRSLVLIALLLALSPRAKAATFVVDDFGELADATPGDGTCKTGAGKCTLVAAMQEANAHSGVDVIQLPPGTYVYTATLPTVTSVMTIEPTTGTDPSATVVQSSSSGHPCLFSVTIGGDLTLDTLTLENAQTGPGSAVQVTSASATLTNCVVTNNTATALSVNASGSLTVSDCTISNNKGTGPGGMDIEFSDVVVSNTTFSKNTGGLAGAAYIYTASDDSHTDSITGSTFSLNTSTSSGGALYIGSDTVRIDSSTFKGNASAQGLYGGGAIYTTALGAGTVITNSTFTGNQANAASGGNGGALFVLNRASCTGCTFSQNVATGNGGAVYAGANDGAEFDAVDSTFSNNEAFGGGAISSGSASGTFKLASVTITKNLATGRHGTTDANQNLGGGGGTNGVDIRARNTIVAGNQSPLGGADCEGQIASQGYDLVGDDTNCSVTASAGNQVGTGGSPIDPGLGALADNGGPTFTHALLASSPAGDAGNPAGCTDNAGGALATDQRGQPRTVDGKGDGIARCDIGAYEAPFGTFAPPTTTTITTTTTTSTTTTTTPTTTTSTAAPTTTSTTTSTTSSTALPTTTSSTSTTHQPTTTTTPPSGCPETPAGATFASIDCRLDALLADLSADAGLGTFGPKLVKNVQTAKARKLDAENFCRESNAKKVKKQLQQAEKALTEYAHHLNGLPARKKIASLRQRFLEEAAPIQSDLKTLRGAVRCPDDAPAG
jgi:trimeric autotransporter adhesin